MVKSVNKVKIKKPKSYLSRKNIIKDYNRFGWASLKNEIPKKLINNFSKISKKIAQKYGYSDMDELVINLDKNDKKKLKKYLNTFQKLQNLKK